MSDGDWVLQRRKEQSKRHRARESQMEGGCSFVYDRQQKHHSPAKVRTEAWRKEQRQPWITGGNDSKQW